MAMTKEEIDNLPLYERGRDAPPTPPAPPRPPKAEPPEPRKRKGKTKLNPFALLVYVFLIASWFGMMWMAKLPVNAFTITGYVFLTLACIMIGFLLILAVKTPAFTFLKAFLYSMPIMEVRRKDGQIDFVLGKYGQGRIHSGKYGVFFTNPDAIKHEKKTGKGIIHVIDSIGTGLTEKFVMFINTMRDKFGFNNIEEIEDGLRRWSRCGCGFEGVPTMKPTKAKIPDKESGEEIEVVEYHETCPDCGKEDTLVRCALPPNFYNTLLALDYGIGDQFLKYNINPDRQEVIIEQEVKNRMAKEKGFPFRPFGILLGVGIMILLICLGMVVLLPKLSAWMAGGMVTPITPPPIIG